MIKLNKIFVKRAITILLVIVLLFCNNGVMIYADSPGGADSGGVGAGGHISPPPGQHSIMRDPAAFISIRQIDNFVTPEAQVKLAAHNASSNVYWSEANYSAVKDTLYDYPMDFMSKFIVERSAAVIMSNTNYSAFSKGLWYLDGSRTSKTAFRGSYRVPRNGTPDLTWRPMGLLHDKIATSTALTTKFINREFTIDEIKAMYASIPQAQKDAQVDAFLKLFSDLEHFDENINKLIYGSDSLSVSSAGTTDSQLYYLDILLIIQEMCTQNVSVNSEKYIYWNEIEDYITTLNQDGSDRFTIVYLSSAVNVNVNSRYLTLASLPTYYALCTGQPPQAYQTFSAGAMVSDPADVTGGELSYQSNSAAFIQALYDQYNGKAGAKAAYSRYWNNNRDLQWWTKAQCNNSGFDNYKAAVSLRPTDLLGNASGNTGYTYFAPFYSKPDADVLFGAATAQKPPSFSGGGGTPITPSAQFTITAHSDTTYVTMPGELVIADVDVSVKQEAKEKSLIKTYYTAMDLLGNQEASLIIDYDFNAVEGSGSSVALIDAVESPAGAVKTGEKQITIPNLKYADIKPLIEGKELITFKDAQIPINSAPTTNKYLASVTLRWDAAHEIKFFAKGKTVESTYVASDKVSWQLKTTLDDHFYSVMRGGNYAEIKHNTIASETYEAMAGVPTTENLYEAFGATEFMSNIDVEYKEDKGKKRIYELKFTFSSCTGKNGGHNNCKYSCPGHSGNCKSGGCGATKADGTKCTSGTGYSVSCSSGEVTGYCKCSCGASTCSGHTYKPKWGAGYKTCGPYYEGMGCVVDGEQCEGGHNCAVTTDGTHAVNENPGHFGKHEFTVKVEQPIDDYAYLNITAAELWQLNQLSYMYNKKLLSNGPHSPWNIGTGFNAFYNQEEYKSGNGRLAFSFKLDDDTEKKSHYGDTQAKKSSGTKQSFKACSNEANAWFNAQLAGKEVEVTVISDFLSLCTTEGYQVLTYNEQESNKVTILPSNAFDQEVSEYTNGNLPAVGAVTFPKVATWDDLWRLFDNGEGDTKSYSASTWNPDELTRSGYTGEYNVSFSNQAQKYTNNNMHLQDEDVTKQWENGDKYHISVRLPNTVITNDAADKTFAKNADNKRMIKDGLDIGDVAISEDRTDNITLNPDKAGPSMRVQNGEWDAGRTFLSAKKVIKFNKTAGGIDYSTGTIPDAGTGLKNVAAEDFWQEAGYTKGKAELNDIVIQDPVSIEKAYVVANDSKYDNRTDKSVGNSPLIDTSRYDGKCPLDMTCGHLTFRNDGLCTYLTDAGKTKVGDRVQLIPHSASCYSSVAPADKHNNAINAHVHDASCFRTIDVQHNDSNNARDLVLPEGTYSVTMAGGAGTQLQGNYDSKYMVDAPIVYFKITIPEGEKVTIRMKTGDVATYSYNEQTKVLKQDAGYPDGKNPLSVQAYWDLSGSNENNTAGTINVAASGGSTRLYVVTEKNGIETETELVVAPGGSGVLYRQKNNSIIKYGRGDVLGIDKNLYNGGGSLKYKTSLLLNSENNKSLVISNVIVTGLTNGNRGKGYVEIFNGMDDPDYTSIDVESVCGYLVWDFTYKEYTVHQKQVDDKGEETIVPTETIVNGCVKAEGRCATCGSIVKTYSIGDEGTIPAPVENEALDSEGNPIKYLDIEKIFKDDKLYIHTKKSKTFKLLTAYPNNPDKYGEDAGTPVKVNTCTNKMNAHVCYKLCGCPKENWSDPEKCNHSWACWSSQEKIMTCKDGHHYLDGAEPSTALALSWTVHNYGDQACSKPCGDDSKHAAGYTVGIHPTTGSTGRPYAMINLDRDFWVYYPDDGDFYQTDAYGIIDTQQQRGKGYTNGMDTTKWTRYKYVTFPVDVLALDKSGSIQTFTAGTAINVYDLYSYGSKWAKEGDFMSLADGDNANGDYYHFYCPIENDEKASAAVVFNSIAVNAEDKYYTENEKPINFERSAYNYAARHTTKLLQYIDVVGYIGSLTINDTEDPRYSMLFKKVDLTKTSLVPNVIPSVDYNSPNLIVSDTINVRQDIMDERPPAGSTAANNGKGYWHDIYNSGTLGSGTLEIHDDPTDLNSPYIGKHMGNPRLPLTSKTLVKYTGWNDLWNQEIRPGYNLLMDVQTVGNYYGENINIDWDTLDTATGSVAFDYLDTNLHYKVDIIPKYYVMDLDNQTGSVANLQEVDVYAKSGDDYVLVNAHHFADSADTRKEVMKALTSHNMYLDWVTQSARRNYTANERIATDLGRKYFSGNVVQGENGTVVNNGSVIGRAPSAMTDYIGSSQWVYLNDLDRTFVGDSYTYGFNTNPQDILFDGKYAVQAQRWHFTLGLPSSSVFVPADSADAWVNGTQKGYTSARAKQIELLNNNKRAVIICAVKILVQGDVWALEYDGTGINDLGIDIPIKNPKDSPNYYQHFDLPENDGYTYIAVYSNRFTAADDLRTEGTH